MHPCPASSGDVPDEQEVRLVILRAVETHRAGDANSAAVIAAGGILENKGTRPRQNPNVLVFLASDRDATEGLNQEVRRFLAWQSVVRDQAALNLDEHQRREASDGEKSSNEAVQLRFNEAYRWLLVPTQLVMDGQPRCARMGNHAGNRQR